MENQGPTGKIRKYCGLCMKSATYGPVMGRLVLLPEKSSLKIKKIKPHFYFWKVRLTEAVPPMDASIPRTLWIRPQSGRFIGADGPCSALAWEWGRFASSLSGKRPRRMGPSPPTSGRWKKQRKMKNKRGRAVGWQRALALISRSVFEAFKVLDILFINHITPVSRYQINDDLVNVVQPGDGGGRAPLGHPGVALHFLRLGDLGQVAAGCVQSNLTGIEAWDILWAVLEIFVFGDLPRFSSLIFQYLHRTARRFRQRQRDLLQRWAGRLICPVSRPHRMASVSRRLADERPWATRQLRRNVKKSM